MIAAFGSGWEKFVIVPEATALFGRTIMFEARSRMRVSRQLVSMTIALGLADLHPVAPAEGPREVQGQPGQDVAEDALQGEAEDGGQDGRGGEEGRDVDAEDPLEDHEDEGQVDDGQDEAVEDAGDRDSAPFVS